MKGHHALSSSSRSSRAQHATLAAPQRTRALQVYFHKESTEQASEHTVRVQRDGNVADVLEQLAQQLGPAAQQRTLRLMEVHSSKLYKVRPWGWAGFSVVGAHRGSYNCGLRPRQWQPGGASPCLAAPCNFLLGSPVANCWCWGVRRQREEVQASGRAGKGNL